MWTRRVNGEKASSAKAARMWSLYWSGTVGHQARVGLQGEDAADPGRDGVEHVEAPEEDVEGADTGHERQPEQDDEIGDGGHQADAPDEEPARQQEQHAGEGGQPHHPAGVVRQGRVRGRVDPDHVEHGLGDQQPCGMPRQGAQDPEMEEIGAEETGSSFR